MGNKPPQSADIEYRGNQNAPNLTTIQYCGGCGYYKDACEASDRIESKYPEKFKYILNKDKVIKGRFEVVMHFNQTEDTGKGVLVHSKVNGQKFPKDDWLGFDRRIDEACMNQGW